MKMNSKKIIATVVVVLVFIFLIVFTLSKQEDIPTHLSAEAVSSKQIMLNWVGNPKTTQYNIYRSQETEDNYIRVGFTSETEYLDEEAQPFTTYHYQVTQVIDFKESSRSRRASATTDLGVPSGLKATTASFQENLQLSVALNWNYSIGAEKYIVYRSEDAEGVYEEIATTVNENYSDTGVLPEKTYYYTVTQITNEQESEYSNEVNVTTGTVWSCGDELEYGGKRYQTIRIGEQCWFRENLSVVDGETDRSCDIERYCYNNDRAMCGVFGGLYTFADTACGQSVDGFQGICPLGWRVPTDKDWIMLETELGMREEEIKKYGFRGSDEGSKLAGRHNLWRSGELRQSRVFSISKMDMLPGGYQPGFNIRLFYDMGERAVFWSSTRANEDEECTFWDSAYYIREVRYDSTKVRRDCHQRSGTAYVRCVRDY